MTLLQDTHPLTATLKRISTFDENAYADLGPLESDWFSAADLTHAESQTLENALTRQIADYSHVEARTRGSYFIGEYSWYVISTAIAAYVAERRVPDLSHENLALRFQRFTWHDHGESGEAERVDVRFLSGRFAALPDDPAATHPDAIILPDLDALREWLRRSVEAHFRPLIERVYTLTRLGRHAQWCLIADSCAGLFLKTGQTVQDEVRAQAEGLAFVKSPDSPMKNPKTGYVSLQYLDHCDTFRTRGGCCRYYTVSETAEKCSTCVLRNPQERDQLLLDYMAKKYAQEMPS